MESDKKYKGRQKIEIKTIERESHRRVTFTKRRDGIYKKASQLPVVCGADVGIFITSPSGRPCSFSHPNIESIANRFLHQNAEQEDPTGNLEESSHNRKQEDPTGNLEESSLNAKIDELGHQLNSVLTQIEAEKRRGKKLNAMRQIRSKNWWETPISELGEDETSKLKRRLQEIQQSLFNELLQQRGEASSSQPNDTSDNI